MYLKIDVSKYTLPEDMIKNNKNVANQNFSKTVIKDFLDLGHENIFDLDNSINSFVGCCSFGTGHLY